MPHCPSGGEGWGPRPASLSLSYASEKRIKCCGVRPTTKREPGRAWVWSGLGTSGAAELRTRPASAQLRSRVTPRCPGAQESQPRRRHEEVHHLI